MSNAAEEAIARAREIAAKLAGSLGGGGGAGSELGKRKNRFGDDDHPGLGSVQRKKIYIPSGGDINYLGILIGPKGVTQKQMSESTGAKIVIRGRGAHKDGSSGQNPDDDDDLHVFLEGSDEAVSKAAYEIEKIINDPQAAMRLKSEQLRQLGGGGGGGAGGASNDPMSIYGAGSSEYQIELRVPNNMVGLIIGRGGENIVRIQTQLGVKCQVAKESEMRPGETLRSIFIKGSPASVDEAKKKIDEVIDMHTNKPQADMNRRELNSPFVVKLPVPNDKVGIIIGKGGMNVKGIQERTGCTVLIPTGPDEDNPQVRTISIGGDTKEIVDAAQMEVFLIMQHQQNSAMNAYNATATAMLVTVPDDKVGMVIGKQGATVKEIQNRLMVRVQIPQTADVGSMPPVRTVSITGTPEAQAQAKFEIEALVSGGHSAHSRLTGKPSGMGGGDYYGGGAGGYYGAQAYGAMQSTYGTPAAAAAADPYAAYAYYYGSSAYPAAAAGTTAAATTSTTSADASTDPTAYYNDFWQYSVYYGEAAARQYYG
eukprot:gene31704-38316_t